MGHQKKHQAHDKQPQGYPQQGGMPLAAFREGFCGELEKRRAADRHRCPGAFRERPDGVVLVGPEVPVDAVERAGLQLVHNLQAGDDGAVVPLHLLFQVPFGPVVHVMEFRRGVFQGRREIAPAVSQAVHQGLRPNIVAADGELVGPALQGVFYVAVHHHVFRQAVQRHPFAHAGM